MSRRFPHILCPLFPTSDSGGVACAVEKTEDPRPWDSDKRGNLYPATSYRITSSDSKGVGCSERQLLFFLSSFLINAKPLVKTFMTRQREMRRFLLNHSSASGLGVLTSFLSSAFFFPLLHFPPTFSQFYFHLYPSLLTLFLIAHIQYTGWVPTPKTYPTWNVKCTKWRKKRKENCYNKTDHAQGKFAWSSQPQQRSL